MREKIVELYSNFIPLETMDNDELLQTLIDAENGWVKDYDWLAEDPSERDPDSDGLWYFHNGEVRTYIIELLRTEILKRMSKT